MSKFTRRARVTLISKPTLPPARVQRLVLSDESDSFRDPLSISAFYVQPLYRSAGNTQVGK